MTYNNANRSERTDDHFLKRVALAEQMTQTLVDEFHAQVVVLHGSVAQAVNNQHDGRMNDIDMLMITDAKPTSKELSEKGLNIDNCNLIIEQQSVIEKIGTVLRYTPKFLVDKRLLGKPSLRIDWDMSEIFKVNDWSLFNRRQHIIACLLLGEKEAYEKYNLGDPRKNKADKDHSAQVVMHDPDNVWANLQSYAQDRRGAHNYIPDLVRGKAGLKASSSE